MSTVFPKWTNQLPNIALGAALIGLATVTGVMWYYFTPKYWRVGYRPIQPGPAGFPHNLHAGKLNMDCRYCHSHVEHAAEANIPSVDTCMGCHAEGHVATTFARNENVQFVRDAWTADASIPWRRVHKLPDYVRNFPHHVHVNAGVSCFSCHGNIMEQPIVHDVEPLSMSWCLDCHRDPTPHLVPKDKVTDLWWARTQLIKTNASGIPTGESTGNPHRPADPTNPLDHGTPGGEGLLRILEEKKNLHLLPQNCGACHY